MIESILDDDGFAIILGNIQEYEILFLEIVTQEHECIKRLRHDGDIFLQQDIAVGRIELIDGGLVHKNDIESEEDFSLLTYHEPLLFTVDEDGVDVCHDLLSTNAMDRFHLLCDNVIEILERKCLCICFENIKSEKRKSALVEHEIMVVFGIFEGLFYDVGK